MLAQGLPIGIAGMCALGVVGEFIGPREADVGLENSIFRTAASASVLKNVQTVVLELAHLVNVKVAGDVNQGIVEFLNR